MTDMSAVASQALISRPSDIQSLASAFSEMSGAAVKYGFLGAASLGASYAAMWLIGLSMSHFFA